MAKRIIKKIAKIIFIRQILTGLCFIYNINLSRGLVILSKNPYNQAANMAPRRFLRSAFLSKLIFLTKKFAAPLKKSEGKMSLYGKMMDLFDLSFEMQASAEGVSIQDIQNKYNCLRLKFLYFSFLLTYGFCLAAYEAI